MSARQLIVLVVAAIAAVGALLLIRGMGKNDAEPVAQSAPIAGTEILVAARDLPQGAALAPGDMRVVLFPAETITPAMIPAGQAQTDMVGAVTRRAFAQGEPITRGSVLQPDGRGFLAAQLDPGFRAVSIAVDPETAAGGYIQPNDHVDVIVTYTVENSGEGGQAVRSEVVLEDIRVLALDDAVQTQASGDKPERVQATVAVLELGANDARVLAGADARGNISLALRGVEAETVGMRRPGAQRAAGLDGGSVRVHSFGRVSNGGGQ